MELLQLDVARLGERFMVGAQLLVLLPQVCGFVLRGAKSPPVRQQRTQRTGRVDDRLAVEATGDLVGKIVEVSFNGSRQGDPRQVVATAPHHRSGDRLGQIDQVRRQGADTSSRESRNR